MFVNFGYAQTIQKVSSKTIGLTEDLTSLNVRKIIQDKNGFFWFSTQDGLNKYDGNKITKFTVDNISAKRKLLGADCYNMEYEKYENFLYVLNGYEGLNIIDVNTAEVFKTVSFRKIQLQKSQEWLKRMIRYHNYLIISTPKKIIFFDTKLCRTESIVNIVSDSIRDINFIETYHDSLFVVLSNGELMTFSLLERKVIDSKIIFKDDDLSSLVCIKNYLFASTNNGIKIFDLKKNVQVNASTYFQNSKQNFEKLQTTSIYFKDNIYYISNSEGIFSYESKTNILKVYKPDKNLNDENEFKSANTIFFSNNQLFIGGAYGVAFFNTNLSKFSSFYSASSSNEKINHIFNLKPISNTKQLVCADDGVYVCDKKLDNIAKIYDKDIVLSGLSISENEHIYSGSKGLYYYINGKATKASKRFKELSKLQNDWLICTEKINDSTIILASQNQTGVYIWNKLHHTLKDITKISVPSLNDLLVNRILKLSDDNILIVSETEINLLTISTFRIKLLFKKNEYKFLGAGVFMDLCKQGSNYYVGTYGLGLVILDSNFKFKKLISSQQGINNIGIYKVFSFNDSLIAITTNNGLSVYNTKSEKVRNYFAEDGLHSNAFEETSGFQKGDTIYAGGIKGFTIFDTKKYTTNNTAPNLYFDNINITTSNKNFDSTNLTIQKLQIPNDVTQTKISFIGLNYENPNRVNYWYKIDELGNNWIDLKTQNFITLIGISPGKYHLQVKAANEDGVECAPIDMVLHFLPKWYQTLLFKILLVLLVATGLYILYSFRIRQLKKVLTVRQKISQNLHDDIGSTLSAINMYTQVAKLQTQSNDFINNIEENTQDALGKLDDIIWSTNPKNDKVKNLVERMDGFARPLLQAKNIQFYFTHSSIVDTQKIGEASRQNLFFIFKEAINNVAKYADCKNCTVILEEKNKYICCSITDDGRGFDPTQPTERNGILNMQLRAKEMKGSFKIESNVLAGTKVMVQLPV